MASSFFFCGENVFYILETIFDHFLRKKSNLMKTVPFLVLFYAFLFAHIISGLREVKEDFEKNCVDLEFGKNSGILSKISEILRLSSIPSTRTHSSCPWSASSVVSAARWSKTSEKNSRILLIRLI